MNKKHCSFEPIISPYALKKPVDWERQFNRCAPVDVEIGFGMGEVLMRMARQSPERNFIGIEQHWERIYKTLRAITREQLIDYELFRNIRILKADARVCFERIFATQSIDKIYCLFPCPWPKKGHIKHRLFSNDFLKLLNSRLKKGGQLKIVTDFYPYSQWVLGEAEHTGFDIKTKTIPSQYDTKFERKWKDEGQEEFFEINFLKKKHVNVSFIEDIKLKNYVLDEVNVGRLALNDQKGDITVIFKDVIFDGDKQKAMIHTIVAEKNLTQDFWITIFKKNQKWRIARAEGQNFFPSEGIASALALVYEAAKQSCCPAGING